MDERVAHYQAYWKRAKVPDNLKTPSGVLIEFGTAYERGTETNPRTIHIGKSSDGSEWVYEHDRGLHPMSPEIQEIINEKP